MNSPRLPVRLSSKVPIAGNWQPTRPFYEQMASTQYWTVSTAWQVAGIEAQINELGYRITDAASLSLQVGAELASLRGDARIEDGAKAYELSNLALFLANSRQDSRFSQEIGEVYALLVVLTQMVAETQQRQQAIINEASTAAQRQELQVFTTQSSAASRLQGDVERAAGAVEGVVQTVANLTTDDVAEGSTNKYFPATTPLQVDVGSGAAVSLTTGTAADIGYIDLTVGTWLVSGNVAFFPAGTTDMSILRAWISTTSATQPSPPNGGAFQQLVLPFSTGSGQSLAAGASVVVVASGTTRVYLGTRCTFGTSTLTAGGHMIAARIL